MKAKQLEKLGFPHAVAKLAKWLAGDARKKGVPLDVVYAKLEAILAAPADHVADEQFGELARALTKKNTIETNYHAGFTPREKPAPYQQWGADLEPQAVGQMQAACVLPVAVAGALMPDAHVGYGLPIGGVLATKDAVIPYAVGVDIACRMKMTVLDLPAKWLQSHEDKLTSALENETRFGVGAEFGKRGDARTSRDVTGRGYREHPVMDEDWTVSPITKQNRDKAASQLGTSGSGNHFVEFGTFTVSRPQAEALGLPWDMGTPASSAGNDETAGWPGLESAKAPERETHDLRIFLTLLSHSGSRGTGASVCDYYSKLAMQQHPELPKELRHLAWLDMSSHEGQEYWNAMELMGKYAAANHACIHRSIAKHLGAKVVLDIENHHNFAWKEEHAIQRSDGTSETMTVIVHRKGATPAQNGVLGIIPGSMASPGYVVRGKGGEGSLDSASHGAGRVMSRTKARETYRWPQVRDLLAKRGVKLLSAGIDEVPFVYKNIDDVMAAQKDLVDVLGRFDPKLVKMAPEGEKAED